MQIARTANIIKEHADILFRNNLKAKKINAIIFNCVCRPPEKLEATVKAIRKHKAQLFNQEVDNRTFHNRVSNLLCMAPEEIEQMVNTQE